VCKKRREEKTSLVDDASGEGLDLNEVLDDLNEVLLLHLGDLVGEAEGLGDLGAIDGKRVVVEELLVQVRGEGGVGDALGLAELRPRLKVLVVDVFRDRVQIQHGKVGDDRALVAGLDAEDVAKEASDGLLVGVASVGEVVDLTLFPLLSDEPEGADHITHMHGVDFQIL